MKSVSKILHLRVDPGDARPSVTPLFQTSAFEAGSAYFYSRKDNPNVAEFEQVIAELALAKHGVAVTCGMAALKLCLDLLRPGETLVVNKLVYGCSFKLFQREADRLGLNLLFADLTDPAAVDGLPAETRMVLFESPTNPFLKTIPIRRVSDAVKAKNPNALIVVDNTWATPLYQRPLQHGADISLHSGTKYFGGHSDVMAGMILVDDDALHEQISSVRFYSGAILDPHSAWLMRRSVQTLALRLAHQSRVTREMVEFLGGLPQIDTVYYPEIDGQQLLDYGGIIFVDLRADLADRYADLAEGLKLFGTGTGMACVTSMIAQPYSGSHASLDDGEKADMGLGRSTVRFCFGLEDPDDLRADLLQALTALDG